MNAAGPSQGVIANSMEPRERGTIVTPFRGEGVWGRVVQ